MTRDEMHIGVDQILQKTNSEVFGDIKSEAMDFFINTVIAEFIRAKVDDYKNTVKRDETFIDNRSFYNDIYTLIAEETLNVTTYDNNSIYANIPESDSISSGVLTAGRTYRVVSGTTNLSLCGGASSPSIGYLFTCYFGHISNAGGAITLRVGCQYKITANVGGVDLSSAGASSSTVNTIFTCTHETTFAENPTKYCTLLVMSHYPNMTTGGWGTCVLVDITNGSYYLYLSSYSNIDTNTQISSGSIVKGNIYKVSVAGTTNLYAYGGDTVPVLNDLFLCTVSGTPSWDGTTVLTLTKYVQNDLRAIQEVQAIRQSFFGKQIENPLCTIMGNRLYVYYNYETTINNIKIQYIKTPASVSSTVDCNLPFSVHPKIVQLTAKFISGVRGNVNYSELNNEIKSLTN